jgi:hypothetical protein
MRTTSFLVLVVVAIAAQPVRSAYGQATTISDEPLSERRVSYAIDAELDPETRTVTAVQRTTWRNPDTVPVDELQFHLYLNAFKSPESTFMRESGGRHRGFSATGDDSWGGIDVRRMVMERERTVASATGELEPELIDLTESIRFIQPDDGNTSDETVISVRLPEAVAPGETIALRIDFESKLPKVSARTGWEETETGEPFFMVAQWFPKIGVYEVPGQRYVPEDAPRGRWNTHQFHANSEFYADFGTYRVSVAVPEDYVVGASGVRVGEETADGVKTLVYAADDVHDFSWTASPAYVEATDQWRHVAIRVLMQPKTAYQAQRHIEALKVALGRFDEWVGEYPYTTLTLVDAVGGAGGMEYPTLITGFTFYREPTWMKTPLESTAIHEFGHQYFYGLLASNEFEEPWLDEGMTSYLESRIMDDAYGHGSELSFAGITIGSRDRQRVSYTKSDPSLGVVYAYAWNHTFGVYGKVSYAKPATLMNSLEGYLGWDTMRQFLRTYYTRWRFNHPTTRDLIDVAEEVSGEDLSWFFDQYVYDDAFVDYRLDRITNRSVEADTTVSFESEVWVERVGDGTFPQTLRVTFGDGSIEDVEWDGRGERWQKFRFENATRVEDAELDPDNKVWLDVNRLNNRRVTQPDVRFAREMQLSVMTVVQHLMFILTGLL